MEQFDYGILFRWFVGLNLHEPIWTPTVFTKNRDCLLNQDVVRCFFQRVVDRASAWTSDSTSRSTARCTLIEAWASRKSFQPKDGPPADAGRDFRGQTRTNDTHASTTDADTRLYRKSHSTAARLAPGPRADGESARVDRRRDDAMTTTADGTAEHDTAMVLLQAYNVKRLARLQTASAI
jgi:uncharacterized heparinase superfamily protein